MKAVKMAYAKTPDGAVVHVDSAKNGLACGCHCIECGEPVVARQGKINLWHFAHNHESTCRGYTKETVIHYRAKHLLAEAAKRDGVHSLVPKVLFAGDMDDSDYSRIDTSWAISGLGVGFTSYYGVNIMERMIPDRNCRVEVEGRSPCKQYQPDVSVYPYVPSDEEEECELGPRVAFVGFEVVVSHDIDDRKLEKIRDANDISFRVLLKDVSPRVTDAELLELIKGRMQVVSYGEGHWVRELQSAGILRKEVVTEMVCKWLGCGINVTLDPLNTSRADGYFRFELDWC